MGPYKTGRLPASRPAALKDLAVYATGVLPRPPASLTSPPGEYPIDGNATYGDCTIAGCDHAVRAWRSLYGATGVLPTEQAIVEEYFRLTGGQDTGLNEAEVLRVWRGPGLGLFGGQIRAYAPVPPKDTLQILQAVAFYGCAYLGIIVGEPQQEQFAEGKPWTWVEGQEEDGHCVVATGYTSTGLLCKTWGGEALLTFGYLAHALEEVWCIISHQLVAAKKDTLGLDLAALEHDLARA
ncbi:MAG TPA: hypothetical protein VMB51_05215 [Solirubrobacteraceae bacterium]|nr:hypothetical protein [Solirubrobacteraceae bacterium]